ncbi:DUF4838 domain-containing protein [Clostridia bacterium]|nr:DUF4838 domain-containing protein [Clostridia bacterium]
MDKTIKFAKSELDGYYEKITGNKNAAIALSVDPGLRTKFYSEEYDALFDDAFVIDVRGGKGTIAGINRRSVLLGVYKFFTALGCRFLNPTPEGERLVRLAPGDCTVRLDFKPDNRHRGITIEGAVSAENVLDIIDWAPKAGFSAYFLQFMDSFTFFERWYTHENNEYASGEYTRAQNAANMKKIVRAIKLRDMIYHAVGHGWTCEAVGYRAAGWHKVDESVIGCKRELLAMTGGERKFFGGIPLNTHLCYGNPEARASFTESVAAYVKRHSEVDVLHVWLADNYNNFCECEKCAEFGPPDQYVRLLNELDARLTADGSNVKIVFLIYYELLWPPEVFRFENPGRFIMMFAPITRTFTNSFLQDGRMPALAGALPEFRLNEIKLLTDTDANLAFLVEWQKLFRGDSFVFDYHLMWDIYKDYGNLSLARTVFEDMKGLNALGTRGFISCQLQRAFFPNGLCMYVLSRALFGGGEDFSALAGEYFSAAFGQNAALAREFFETVSGLFDYKKIRGELPLDKAFAKGMEEAPAALEFYRAAFQNARPENAAEAQSLSHALIFIGFLEPLADMLCLKARNAPKELLQEKFARFEKLLYETEPEIQSVLDGYFYQLILKGYFEADVPVDAEA